MINKLKRNLIIACCIAVMGWSAADAAVLTNMRSVEGTGQTRIVLDLDGAPTGWSSVYNENTNVLKITLPNTTNKSTISFNKKSVLIKDVGVSSAGKNIVVSIEGKQPIQKNIFALANPDRLVIDVYTNIEQKTTTSLGSSGQLLKWSKSGDNGRLRIYKAFVPSTAKMTVLHSNTPQTLTNLANSHGGTIFFGVETPIVKPLTNGKSLVSDTNDLEASNALRYTYSNGYSINTVEPSLVAALGKEDLHINGVNQTRLANSLILYTPAFGESTNTNTYGHEVVIKNRKVVRVGEGNSKINAGEFVLSGHGTVGKELAKIKVGDSANIYRTAGIAKISVKDAVVYSGGDEVLRKGAYVGPKTATSRGARNYIGVTSAGNLILLSIDGHSAESVGVTAQEGAVLLREAGAINGLEVTNKGHNDMIVNKKVITQDGKDSGAEYTDAIVIP